MERMERWSRFFSLVIGFFGIGVVIFFTIVPDFFAQEVFDLNMAGGKISAWLWVSYLIFMMWVFFLKDIPDSWIKFIIINAVMMAGWFLFFIFKLKTLEMSLEMIHFSVSFFMITIVNITIVIFSLFLLGINILNAWNELIKDNYRGIKFLVSSALKNVYFMATVFFGIVAISLSAFVVWFGLFSDAKIMPGDLSFAIILVIDFISYFVALCFFLKKGEKEYEIKKMNTIYDSRNIA